MGLPEGLMSDIVEHLEQEGFYLLRGAATVAEVASLQGILGQADIARSERGGETYGARGLLQLLEVHAVANLPAIAAALCAVMGDGFRAVRGLFFDKTQGANWPVLWHQDLSLAVRERYDLPGWNNWSIKRGTHHVQPPPEILARLVTLRLHLDDCPAENGALRVLPASHRQGILSRDAIRDIGDDRARAITAEAGDALLMRPLILHASRPAQAPTHRRVLHLEFAPDDLLPAGLTWAEG
jgi:hypothetical protein